MLIDWLLSLAPVALVLALMLGLRWKGRQAGLVGWLAAALIATTRFEAGWDVLAWAQLKGLSLSAWVLYVIVAALVFYRVTDEAGAVSAIGETLTRLTQDRTMQALILGWVFGAFLQGISGFGMPVAVLGPIMLGLGFSPVSSVAIPSIGHSWAVTFGSLGSSFYTLMAATGRPGEELAVPCALMLGVVCLLCGAGVLWASGGVRALQRYAAPFLAIGLTMSGVQLISAAGGLWTVAALCGAMAGLALGVTLARWQSQRAGSEEKVEGRASLMWAMVPYVLLVGIVLVAELVSPINSLLGSVVLQVSTPELTTGRGWVTPAGSTRSINIFGHAGALLIYAGLVTYTLFRLQGRYKPGIERRVLSSATQRALPAGLGILSMVGMAVTMDHAGMTHLLAEGISAAVGESFPLASPLIGALGAFMTGSNTNSNVVFGGLQERVAILVGMSPLLALAAQTSGGAIGGMFAPAKIIVGCAPVEADEGATMRKAMGYGVVILAGLAATTFIAAKLL